ncbi:hypothetical protein [Thalassococcus sp. S3]|uniref:hypothetical protein n=1 Tax=Thalassococcus sp. S3 TaxID=2017482 RepID=UPI0010245F32|nr:hypothetical protein [Thalassococcus sp. S3]QBF32048.1 hypothetical protein CFI11_12565 [Thalassococcus sp. S3]
MAFLADHLPNGPFNGLMFLQGAGALQTMGAVPDDEPDFILTPDDGGVACVVEAWDGAAVHLAETLRVMAGGQAAEIRVVAD